MGWQDRFSIAGKTALVTGASSGIGAEIVRVFTQAGARVIASGQSHERLQAIATRTECDTIAADIASAEGCERLVTGALDLSSRIDILVNSAGVALVGSVLDYSVDNWDRTLAINLRAPFLLAKALAPQMIAAKAGKIINISSQTGVIALTDHAAYAASKGGVAQLTKALSNDWAAKGICVNAIAPGYMDTQLNTALIADKKRTDEVMLRVPMKRWGDGEDLKGLTVFLSSAASDYITGCVIPVDGGYLAR